jgi:hypothetical protein
VPRVVVELAGMCLCLCGYLSPSYHPALSPLPQLYTHMFPIFFAHININLEPVPPLITATHLPFSPSLPRHCHSPRLALTSQLASPSFRASGVSSHCLSASLPLVSLPLIIFALASTIFTRPHIPAFSALCILSAHSPPLPQIVHLLLSFHVNLSPLASALLAVSPRPTTSPFRYRIPLGLGEEFADWFGWDTLLVSLYQLSLCASLHLFCIHRP